MFKGLRSLQSKPKYRERRFRLYLTTLFLLLSVSICHGQAQQPLSADERRQILKALIDLDEAQGKVRELQGLLSLSDEQLRLAADRLKLERDQRLNEKSLHLSALKALAEYQIKRRPLIVKLFTLGIVRNKHNKLLEEQIMNLEMEIANWK